MTTYSYRDNARVPGVEAEAAHAELERIRAKDADAKLSPLAVVAESRPETAVLHPAFEWDDKVAAEQYRVGQARRVIRSVCVVQGEAEVEPPSPVFVHVEPNNYQPVSVVIERPDLFQAALQQLYVHFTAAERAVRELERAAKEGNQPDRLAAIALATQGFEAVREALAIIK